MDSSNPGPSSSYTLNIAPLILNDISFSVIISILILCKFTQFPINKRTTTCLSLRDNAACCIPLRNQRYLRENIHIRGLYQLTKIPQETLTTNCLSLRNNTACCIPLRHLRHLRENIHIRVLNLYCTNETPMSPADLADDADKTQNGKTTITIKQT